MTHATEELYRTLTVPIRVLHDAFSFQLVVLKLPVVAVVIGKHS